MSNHTTPTNGLTTKQHAALLLRRYDQLRKEIRQTERDLNRAATNYGRELGYYGFTKDMLRIRLENEEQLRMEDAADRDAWEKANT